MTMLLRLAVTVMALWFLFSVYDFRAAMRMVGNIGPAPFLTAAGLCGLCVVIGAAKWRILLREVPLRTLLHGVLASCFYSILPTGQLGGELSKVLIVKARHPQVPHVLASVLFDKLTGVAGLLLLCAFALALSKGVTPSWQVYLTGAVMLGCSGPLLLAPMMARLVTAMPIGRLPLLHARTVLSSALLQLSQFSRNRQLLVRSLAYGIVSQGTVIVLYLVVGHALGIAASVAEFAAVVAFANLAALLPISLGGFGVREVGLTALLVQLPNVSGEQGLALSVVTLFIFLLAALAGAAVEATSIAAKRIRF